MSKEDRKIPRKKRGEILYEINYEQRRQKNPEKENRIQGIKKTYL